MTNEELAVMIQSGQRDKLLELWAQVERFARWRAIRWEWVLGDRGSVTLDDLMQAAFLAFLDTLKRWEPGEYVFLTVYGNRLKAAFTEAYGLRTSRTRKDPLNDAISLDASIGDDVDDSVTLGDMQPDPTAELSFENVIERDQAARLHAALESALSQLPAKQREAVVGKYYRGREVDKKALNDGIRALRHPRLSMELRQFCRQAKAPQNESKKKRPFNATYLSYKGSVKG